MNTISEENRRLFETAIQNLKNNINKGNDGRLPAVAYIQSIAEVVGKIKNETTCAGFVNVISSYIQMLCDFADDLSITSACALFRAYLKRNLYGNKLNQSHLRTKVNEFLKMCETSRDKIAVKMLPYITDGCKICMLGFSRCIEYSLKLAIEKGRIFTVYIALTRVDKHTCSKIGEFIELLKQNNIPIILVPLDNILHCLKEVDFVISGTMAITQNGGAINSTGSAITALAAKFLKKPFYILCEFLKFNKLYILDDLDLPDGIGPKRNLLNVHDEFKDLVQKHKIDLLDDDADYTPPDCITLIITDSGIHTPQSAADELANAYLL